MNDVVAYAETGIESWKDGGELVAGLDSPEQLGRLLEKHERLVRKKGASLEFPAGVELLPDSPVLRCVSKKVSGRFRACMVQGLGEAHCGPQAALLPLDDDSKDQSLLDGLGLHGVPLDPFLREIFRVLSQEKSEVLFCPLLTHWLSPKPPLTPAEFGQWWAQPENQTVRVFSILAAGGHEEQALAAEALPVEGPRLAWGLDEALPPFALHAGGLLYVEQGGRFRRWVPGADTTDTLVDRGGPDTILVLPTRYRLISRRLETGRKPGAQGLSLMLLMEDGLHVRQVDPHFAGLCSLGSLPMGPRLSMAADARSMGFYCADCYPRCILVQKREVSGDTFQLAPMTNGSAMVVSNTGEAWLFERGALWTLTASWPGQRWPVNPWFSTLFDAIQDFEVVPGGRTALLSGGGRRLTFLDAVGDPREKRAGSATNPLLTVDEELALPRPAKSLSCDRLGNLYLAGDGFLLRRGARGEFFLTLVDTDETMAVKGGGFLFRQGASLRFVPPLAPLALENFGEGLAAHLAVVEKEALETLTSRSARVTAPENLHSLTKRRFRDRPVEPE
jgi:hypothetical protein